MPFEPAATTEAKGPISAAVRKLAEMLAETDAFRAAVGAETVSDGLQSIYPIERIMQWREDPDRPFAVVWCWPWTFASVNGRALALRSVTVNVALSYPAVRGEDLENGPPAFTDWIDEIVQQMGELSGIDDRLCLQSCRPNGELGVPDFDGEENPVWRCTVQFIVGATGGGD